MSVIEAVVTIARYDGDTEEHVYQCGQLSEAVSDLEKLHNEVLTYRDGGRGSDRGYQFCTVFGAGIKPAYVLEARVRVVYPAI